jgi:hypothetical protein
VAGAMVTDVPQWQERWLPIEKARFSFGKVHLTRDDDEVAELYSLDIANASGVEATRESSMQEVPILCSRVELDASGLHSRNG